MYDRGSLSNFVKSQGGNLETLGQAPSYTGAPALRGSPAGMPMGAQTHANPAAMGRSNMGAPMPGFPQGSNNRVMNNSRPSFQAPLYPQATTSPVQPQMNMPTRQPMGGDNIQQAMGARPIPNTRMQNARGQQMARQKQMMAMKRRNQMQQMQQDRNNRIMQLMRGRSGGPNAR